jgi:hypothetical protein
MNQGVLPPEGMRVIRDAGSHYLLLLEIDAGERDAGKVLWHTSEHRPKAAADLAVLGIAGK